MAERTDFLYPFLGDDGSDPGPLLRDLASSAVAKGRESAALRVQVVDEAAVAIAEAAAAMAERFRSGGRLLTFGNGGSSTDAAGLAALFDSPPRGAPLPARCLVDDQAVLTALGNDVGFDLVFSRQVIAYGRPVDIALGTSTSGNSRNLLAAFEEASNRGLLTVGLAGDEGGDMGRSAHVAHCLVARSTSIHRIQEGQAALGFALWAAVQEALDG